MAVAFINAGNQASAIFANFESAQDAINMPKFPHDYVQCPNCSHVWNKCFDYNNIPYSEKPNRMFNTGTIWKGHLAYTRDKLIEYLPNNPTVIDIGCGEGHFVRGIAETLNYQGRFMGFDPTNFSNANEIGKGLEFYAELFFPHIHFAKFQPDAVVIRHVLEHLPNPAAFVESIAFYSSKQNKTCYLFAECPCIDNVFKTNRQTDFFYEHMSHFSTKSFLHLMQRAGNILEISHGYDKEVIYALVELATKPQILANVKQSEQFFIRSQQNQQQIIHEVNALYLNATKQHKKIAVWGGTGKAAHFIHIFGLDKDRFPIIVDSDKSKCGGFVPGSGQKIQFRDILKTNPVQIIIIPTQWRAKDIILEMQRENINYQEIYIEHDGHLINFAQQEHPYK